ncbi:MAG TPA: hypothetical protein PLM73_02745 [Petrotogaceae bacterium]|nr:hypothetical protein [Petrotogaceae bacterium]HQF32601.1 hypothetical protein [Petrotogaceae bacterium]HQH32827.1 hypothetical protein [Petrotogaceae bacterium]HQI78418.1 hypothetical protein [Petrotogaceae bacterium]
MKLYAGNPINAIEFMNDDLNLIISTSPWSFKDQGMAVIIIDKKIKLYTGDQAYEINSGSRFLNLNEYKLCFGFGHDCLNYDFFFMNWIKNTDLIVLSINIEKKENYEKFFDHIASNISIVKVPTLLLFCIDENFFTAIFDESNSYKTEKNNYQLYCYTGILKKEKRLVLKDKHIRELTSSLKTIRKRIINNK